MTMAMKEAVRRMGYVILCYRNESVVEAASRADEALVRGRIDNAVDALIADGRLNCAVGLLATTTSITVRLLRGAPLILDGPVADGADQLQSIYLVEGAKLDDALAVAGAFAAIEPGAVYEVRPVATVFASQNVEGVYGRD